MAPPTSDIAASLKSLNVRRALWLNRGRLESSEMPSQRAMNESLAAEPTRHGWGDRLALSGYTAK